MKLGIRGKLIRYLSRGEIEIYQCRVCGRLHTNANDLLWHMNECAYANAGVLMNMSSFRASK